MQSATSMKAGAAFLAGVLVALGGAVIYLKASDSRRATALQVSALEDKEVSPAPTASPSTESGAAPDSALAPAAAPKAADTPKDAVATEPQTKHLHHQNVLSAKPRKTRRPLALTLPHEKLRSVFQAGVQDLPAPPLVDMPAAGTMPSGTTESPVQPRQPHTVTIPAGTSLAVRVTERLSTDHNFSGDAFRATLETPILVDGFIIADRGAKVLGQIVSARKTGKFEGTSELNLTLTEISTTDGQQMRVQTNESLRRGRSNKNDEVLKMSGAAALGAIIGAIAGGGKGAAIGAGAGGAAGTGAVLLGHGRPAVIESETQLTFTLASPTTLTERLN